MSNAEKTNSRLVKELNVTEHKLKSYNDINQKMREKHASYTKNLEKEHEL